MTPTAPVQFVERPDSVGADPITALMSAIAFTMTTVPPKPSIHEMLIGAYEPDNTTFALSGVGAQGEACVGTVNMPTDATTRIVKNQWMAAISVINGGVECNNAGGVTQAVTRTSYYVTWLGVLGLPPANWTQDETTYLPQTLAQNIGCNMCKGTPFALQMGVPIGWKPRMVWLLDCNPKDSNYTNPLCLRRYTKETDQITGCTLGSFQDKFYNQLLYSPSAAECQTSPYGACKCGRNVYPPDKSCPCCTFPDGILAVTPQSAQLCANITAGFKWADPPPPSPG